jgi:methyltransferase (TIGR00027 family)
VEQAQASRTAERVAARRAAHQILDVPPVFSDPLAFAILPEELAARIRNDPSTQEGSPLSRYLRAFLAVRSRFAEDTLAAAVAQGLTQYVLIGAGYDTFAYRNPYPELRVFEVDHPATQAAKRARLTAAGIALPESLTFVSADLAIRTLQDALAESSFDPARPAVFAWLGVVPYLERPAIEATLRFIASLATGTAVVFDYGIPRHSLGFLARLAFDRMADRVAAIGEPWKSFFTPSDLRDLLLDLGFTSIEDLGASELNGRYFADRKDHLRVGEAGRIAKAVT